MNKRAFAKTSLAVATAGCLSPAVSAAPAKDGKEESERDWYELRAYTLKAAKLPILENYLAKAFIPAVGRLGLGPVGVFMEPAVEDKMSVNVLIVGKSAAKLATLGEKIALDTVYQKDAADFLNATAADPVYERIETFLMHAIEGLPKIEKTDASKPRVLNLRIYESHNERAGVKKVEMFNEGEFGVFQRAQMPMVFCGQTIIGGKMPNLTYMLTFPDEAGRKAGWGRFGKNDPVWKKFRSMHEYDDKEIVMHITNRVLTPTSYSQL